MNEYTSGTSALKRESEARGVASNVIEFRRSASREALPAKPAETAVEGSDLQEEPLWMKVASTVTCIVVAGGSWGLFAYAYLSLIFS